MAIIQGLNGLVVMILVFDGTGYKFTKECTYSNGSPAGVVTKYIQAKSNQQFAIRWCFTRDIFPFKDEHIMSSVYLDGQLVDTLAFDSSLLQSQGRYRYMLDGARINKNGKSYQLPFSFAKLEIVEDNGAINDTGLEKQASAIGEITVRCWRVEKVGEMKAEKTHNRITSFKALDTVPLQALKSQAISHQACLGDAQPIANLDPGWEIRWIDPVHAPFAEFNFRYRSLSEPEGTSLEGKTALNELRTKPRKNRRKKQRATAYRRQASNETEADVKEQEGGDDDDGGQRERKRRKLQIGPWEEVEAQTVERLDLTGE
ncbi:uncharacterized protein BKCO1_2900029 [Diplodia corticola]|uniref:DUF7918 domain-containing protein n=1 Tax=Diplodia corticola TaxID=236234 RepID=A0A1J9RYV7_9PEZI|nr:uncharacterized protein BKCO1_2900029 [Diplodia corticola]OJD33535.1 hypothetical protein BKCO1_2900029 [Diplodia corticola]